MVVRCGGGFMDFAEFGRKNGSVEQLKLLRAQRPGSNTSGGIRSRLESATARDGKMVVRAVSVLSNGTRNIRSCVPVRRAGA